MGMENGNGNVANEKLYRANKAIILQLLRATTTIMIIHLGTVYHVESVEQLSGVEFGLGGENSLM